MTLTDIRTQPIEQVRAFVDEFAKKADVRDPKVINLLHAAKSRIVVENGRHWLARKKRG